MHRATWVVVVPAVKPDGIILANQFRGRHSDAALLLGKSSFALLKRRVEAEWLVLHLSGQLDAAVSTMHQAALLQSRQVASNAGCRRIEKHRQLIHRAVSVAQ